MLGVVASLRWFTNKSLRNLPTDLTSLQGDKLSSSKRFTTKCCGVVGEIFHQHLEVLIPKMAGSKKGKSRRTFKSQSFNSSETHDFWLNFIELYLNWVNI